MEGNEGAVWVARCQKRAQEWAFIAGVRLVKNGVQELGKHVDGQQPLVRVWLFQADDGHYFEGLEGMRYAEAAFCIVEKLAAEMEPAKLYDWFTSSWGLSMIKLHDIMNKDNQEFNIARFNALYEEECRGSSQRDG